jgi:hypothetical protein
VCVINECRHCMAHHQIVYINDTLPFSQHGLTLNCVYSSSQIVFVSVTLIARYQQGFDFEFIDYIFKFKCYMVFGKGVGGAINDCVVIK